MQNDAVVQVAAPNIDEIDLPTTEMKRYGIGKVTVGMAVGRCSPAMAARVISCPTTVVRIGNYFPAGTVILAIMAVDEVFDGLIKVLLVFRLEPFCGVYIDRIGNQHAAGRDVEDEK